MFDSFSFTLLCVAYLVWYAWQVFIKDKGNLGGLGMTIGIFAWFQIGGWLLG
jgi:hypothetical protein